MKNAVIPPTFLFCFLSILSSAFTQDPSFSWNVSWGNTELDFNPSLATDQDGSVFCTGYFLGTVDFDPGPGQATLTSGSGGFGRDTYISKFDSTGQFLWVKQIGGQSTPHALLMDDAGHLHIGGEFVLTGDFDPGPGIFNMTSSNNSYDLYILTLDHDGNFIDAYQVGGNGQEYFGSMTVDQHGNMLIGGVFTGTSDFDPGIGEAIFTSGMSVFSNDLFVVKYDAGSSFIWAKEISGNIGGGISEIVIDSTNNIYIAGAFDDFRDFDPGLDSIILAAMGGWDIYVLKWNEDGEFIWVRHLGNIDGDNWAHDLVMTNEEDLLVTGHFTGTLDFNTGPGTFEMTATNSDPYIWKLDLDGNFIWSVQFEGVSFDQGRDITLDEHGNIYSTGWFGDVSDFDPGPGNYSLTSSGGNDKDDGFITKLSPDGHFIWAESVGGVEDDYGREVNVDRFGYVFITGNFQGHASFNPMHQKPDSLASKGSWDTFLVRWSQCAETSGEINASGCKDYVSPSGNHVWNTSGDYLDTLTNVAGCDSILTIHLTVTHLNTEVTVQFNASLTAVQEGVTYQWLNCDKGFEAIPEATEQIYFPVASGNYAVILSDGICVDTSACVNAIVVSTDEQDHEAIIRIYPNPAHQKWFVQTVDNTGDIMIDIVDLCGSKHYYGAYFDTDLVEMDADLPPGIYLVRVISGDQQKVEKLVIH
jgi:hypothetical protein